MSYLKKLLFLAGLTVILSSFSFVSAQSSPDLELSSIGLQSQRSVTFNERFTAALSGRAEDDYVFGRRKPGVSRSRDRVFYSSGSNKATVVARNTGTKTIKAFTWELSFYNDPQMSQLLESHQIHSKKKIPAGAISLLNGKARLWAKSGTDYFQIRPLRIEYTDGTIWEAP